MIEEAAEVVAIEGEFAWVETRRRSTCEACSVNKGCGTGVLSKALGNRRNRIKVLNPKQARIGDRVIVAIAEDALLRGSVVVYLVPLLLLFIFGLLGRHLGQNIQVLGDGIETFFGMLGLLLGFVWLAYFSKTIRRDTRYHPSIARMLP